MVACAAEEKGNSEIYVMYADGSDAVFSYKSEAEAEMALAELSEEENVVLASPNYRYEAEAFSSSDEYVSRQWALSNDGSFFMEERKNEHPVFDTPFGNAKKPGEWKRPQSIGGRGFRGFATENSSVASAAKEGIDINLEAALELYKDSGREVTVAFVDTGIDITHEELRDSVWINEDEIADNGKDDDGNGYIDDVYGWNFYANTNKVYNGSEDDHGTHGAGTVAAKSDNGKGIAGIAQSENIKVMSVKALGGASGSGSTASIIRAIQYAEKNGADICNLSLGTSYNDSAVYQVIANSNMLFVVASGNDGKNTDKSPSYPAAYDLPNIISVANLSYDGNLHESSNYGTTTVDIAAPGAYILSTTTSGTYSYMTGTSMSAPMVSGAAALVLSHFGNEVSLADVREIIIGSAKKLESLSGSSVSGGMLDIGAALAYDLTTLSGDEWEEKTPVEYAGKAPQISISLVSGRGEQYLRVKLNDEDGDAKTLKYCEGTQSEEFFKSGGEELALDENKIAYLVPRAGTFTFWASDERGNTSVCSVTISESDTNFSRRGRGSLPRTPYGRELEAQEELFREITEKMLREFFR